MRRTLGSHGRLLSDGGAKKHFHKMNGNDIKVLRRGASVQQLGCTSSLLPSQMEDFDVSFAETFTTLSSSRKQKKLDDIKEEHVNGVSPYVPYLITTIKEVFELKNKNTSSLSIERLVKKFCSEYETLGKLCGIRILKN